MVKDLVLKVTSEMADNATLEEIFNAVIVRLSIKKGLDDIQNGKFTTHEDLKKEIELWK